MCRLTRRAASLGVPLKKGRSVVSGEAPRFDFNRPLSRSDGLSALPHLHNRCDA